MSENARILLVDDEQSVLNALQRLFRRFGYEVFLCTSGLQGLELMAQSEPFNLVISDYRMPGMNGVEFLSTVRERWPDTVRMVLSGFADTHAIISATNEGNIYKFIAKPWDEEFLLQSVRDALELNAHNLKQSRQLDALSSALASLDDLHAQNLANQSQVVTIYHTLLDQMPVGMVGLDRDAEIVSINKRAQEMLGLSVAPLGEPACKVLPGICGDGSPDMICNITSASFWINERQVQVLVKHLKEGTSEGIMLILVLMDKES
jgi:two-component system, NtrC family, sensor kinase